MELLPNHHMVIDEKNSTHIKFTAGIASFPVQGL